MKSTVSALLFVSSFLYCARVAAHEDGDHEHDTQTEDQATLLHSILHNFAYFSQNIRDLPGLVEQIKISFGETMGQTLINIIALGFDPSFVEGLLDRAAASGDGLSDMPSDVPSDAPSMVPSDSPSIMPQFWDMGWDPSDADENTPVGFRACESAGGSNLDLAAKLTVIYGYRIELKPDEVLTPIIKKIEDMILRELYQDMCSTPEEGALALSLVRDDKPGAWCEVNPDLPGPCFYISGKVELLVNEDVEKDSQAIYCNALGVIGSVLSTTADKQDQVSKVSSTLTTDDRTRFCTLSGDRDSTGAAIQGGNITFPSRNRTGLQWTLISLLVAGILAVAMFVFLVVWNRRRPARSPRRRRGGGDTPRTDFASMMNLYPRRDEEKHNEDDDSFVSFNEVWKSQSHD